MPEIKLIDLHDVEWVPVKVEPVLGEVIKLGMFLDDDPDAHEKMNTRLGKFGLIKEVHKNEH